MTKREKLIADLSTGWVSGPNILKETGWKPHSMRAVISGIGIKDGLTVERKRENGITSYRIVEKTSEARNEIPVRSAHL